MRKYIFHPEPNIHFHDICKHQVGQIDTIDYRPFITNVVHILVFLLFLRGIFLLSDLKQVAAKTLFLPVEVQQVLLLSQW